MAVFKHKFIQKLNAAVNVLIVFNAIAFGLITDKAFVQWHPLLNLFCDISIVIFAVELIVRLFHYRKDFFIGQDKYWNLFDMTIVLLSILASIPFFSTMRIFRVLRIFRQLNILRIIPSAYQLRLIIEAIITSLPGVAWTSAFFFIIIYIYGLLGTVFFGEAFPDWFGNVWNSVYTLFQVMTLESWSMGIARPIMTIYPYAWLYFISYVIFAAFVILNIIVALVVNSLQEAKERNRAASKENANDSGSQAETVNEKLVRIENLIDEIKDMTGR